MKSVLYPYLLRETWVFDDERTGLKAEAFVLGMTEMISRMIAAKALPHAEQGFQMTFSDEPMAAADAELHWLRSDDPAAPMSGNWYRGEVAGEQMEGWLCPALLLYFKTQPARVYVQADPLPAGIDPIWHDPDGRGRRFVSAKDE